MLALAVFMVFLPPLVICSSDGNIHLLEEEVAAAIRACTQNNSEPSYVSKRYSRSDRTTSNLYNQYPRVDSNTENLNPYYHERRNTNHIMTPNNVSTITNNDLSGYGKQYENEHFNDTTRTNFYNKNNKTSTRRTKRNVQLLEKYEEDQCLSQCVFANLHMVDSRGKPREAELWNKIQAEVTSQQSRVLLQDQIKSCFQELQTESEDNDCSYSNKLERCLMLRFSDRIKGTIR